MRDPHVVKLTYRLQTDEAVSFKNPPPIQHETDLFRMKLKDGTATFELKQHFPDAKSSRQLIDPWLRSWEIDDALDRGGNPDISFQYEDAEVIDRNPPRPDEPVTLQVESLRVGVRFGTQVTVHVGRGQYPKPPDRFEAHTDVQASSPWPTSA